MNLLDLWGCDSVTVWQCEDIWHHYRPTDVRTFLSPPDVTNSLLALGSWGRTLENWPTTCLRMLGGASWRRGSRAGRWTQRVKMFLRAFLDCEEREWGSCGLGFKLITLEVASAQLPLYQLKLPNTRVQSPILQQSPPWHTPTMCASLWKRTSTVTVSFALKVWAVWADVEQLCTLLQFKSHSA